jgi:hypothetical protein
MAKIIPVYSPEYLPYRIPDQITNPTNSNTDYFITANNKNFVFKKENGEVTYVNIDFLRLDHLYYNKTLFTTV